MSDTTPRHPRYPDLHVRLHSRNPFALVSAVRLEMRRAHLDPGEVSRFTEEALATEEPRRIRRVCGSWADVGGDS